MRRRLFAGAGSDSRLAALFRDDPAAVDYDALRRAAADDDPLAAEVVETAAGWLATAVVGAAALVLYAAYSPQVSELLSLPRRVATSG